MSSRISCQSQCSRSRESRVEGVIASKCALHQPYQCNYTSRILLVLLLLLHKLATALTCSYLWPLSSQLSVSTNLCSGPWNSMIGECEITTRRDIASSTITSWFLYYSSTMCWLQGILKVFDWSFSLSACVRTSLLRAFGSNALSYQCNISEREPGP